MATRAERILARARQIREEKQRIMIEERPESLPERVQLVEIDGRGEFERIKKKWDRSILEGFYAVCEKFNGDLLISDWSIELRWNVLGDDWDSTWVTQEKTIWGRIYKVRGELWEGKDVDELIALALSNFYHHYSEI